MCGAHARERAQTGQIGEAITVSDAENGRRGEIVEPGQVLKRKVIASGDQIIDARTGSNEGQPIVSITLDSAGGESMLETTMANLNKPMATVFIETNSPFLSKGWPILKKPELPLIYRARLGKRFEVSGNVKSFVSELEAYYRQELEPQPARQTSTENAAPGVEGSATAS